jgi:hypothetical protein
MDLLSYDCHARQEPDLASLFVRTDTGEVGPGYLGEYPEVARKQCHYHWTVLVRSSPWD